MNVRCLSDGSGAWQPSLWLRDGFSLRGGWPVGKIFGRPAVWLVMLAGLLGSGRLEAANNPLSNINADSYSARSSGIKTEPCDEGGTNICSVHDGDFVEYRGFDFDSGVAGFKARISSSASGSMEIRLDALTGPLLGSLSFKNTGGWQSWQDITCKVDNSQAGVRDIFLLFHGNSRKSLVNIRSFCFLKSIAIQKTEEPLNLQNRIDVPDGEVQSKNSWGMPENGFSDDFKDGHLSHWDSKGLVVKKAMGKGMSVVSEGTNFNYAIAPRVYINKTDTGGQWRSLAEAALSAEIVLDSKTASPGIGFASKDGEQGLCVVLNPESDSIQVWRNFGKAGATLIKNYALTNKVALQQNVPYRLRLNWSPYSDGLIVFLEDESGHGLVNFRTVIDLPAARYPLMACSGGAARFNSLVFDPTIDGWNFAWQWKKTPILASDVCNPAVWKGKNGKYYMMWRKFGQDTYHGIASSSDGVQWNRVNDAVLKCTGDMNVVLDPFGDGLVYVTGGGNNMAWYSCDGSSDYTVWKDTGRTVGNIFGNSRIQEIIDTKRNPALQPIHFQGQDYRFIGFTENWVKRPQPHTVVLLSNTLTNWVLADPEPLLPPAADFWGEKGSAIGSAVVLPDGNILLASCSCTFAGYTGAPEPSNISVIVDGKQPWRVLKCGILPDAPVSREDVWYQGPNFGTAFYYEPENDTLFFYGGFHDYNIGMMRVEHFSKSKLFTAESSRIALLPPRK